MCERQTETERQRNGDKQRQREKNEDKISINLGTVEKGRTQQPRVMRQIQTLFPAKKPSWMRGKNKAETFTNSTASLLTKRDPCVGYVEPQKSAFPSQVTCLQQARQSKNMMTQSNILMD